MICERPKVGPHAALMRALIASDLEADIVVVAIGRANFVTGDMLKKDGRGQGGQVAAVRASIAAAENEEGAANSQPAAPQGAPNAAPAERTPVDLELVP